MVKPFAIILATALCSTGWTADRLPARAQELVDGFLKERQVIEQNATERIAALKAKAAKELLALHDQFKTSGDLPRAEAVLSQLVIIHTEPKDILLNPGSLSGKAKQPGQQFVIAVTGKMGGSVWGTDVYTADSAVATVAVHTGHARVGEAVLLLATATPGRARYTGSNRNGVKSSDYGNYSISYQLLRIGPVPARLFPQNQNEEDAP